MDRDALFDETAIVACGTVRMELNVLREQGRLKPRKMLYTRPGRHDDPKDLEIRLVRRVRQAKTYADRVIVVYGGKFCYIHAGDPYRSMDSIIEELGSDVVRINATHCVDMLAGADEREEIRAGEKVFWLTPGWVVYRNFVFQDWDRGKANENFPQHTGGAVLLDGVGFWEAYSASHPEEILDFSDWMGIPIRPYPVSLDRLMDLLCDAALRDSRSGVGKGEERCR
jgi:hypothetical protein